MPTVLITGANRGIGLEFARQYSSDGWNVVAAVREGSPELDSLNVRVEQLDMRDLNAVATFSDRLESLDLLIANAGTYGPRSPRTGEDGEEWLAALAVNTVAPYLLAESVLPLVAKNSGKLIAISSRMGSIEDNGSGGYIAYRSSKSALNMAWRSLANALHRRLLRLQRLFAHAVRIDHRPLSGARSRGPRRADRHPPGAGNHRRSDLRPRPSFGWLSD
jgi:NAD(P)-dependent dehydrogenase (short-subunit alcohol dehydrogenase family)